jgi:hypothetical protein
MRKLLLIPVAFLYITISFGQKSHSLEFGIIGQYDKHADYTTRFGNRSFTDDMELWGKSLGFHVNYKRSWHRYLNAKIGIGYYQLGIDKIRSPTRFNTIAKSRNIDYQHPSGIQPLFSTSKYHYDNLHVSIGFFYKKSYSKKADIIVGADFNGLYTFSQLYHINYDQIKYRTNDSRILGYSINTYFGFEKKLNTKNYYLSPKILLPIYQNLRGDKAFEEDPEITMEKWLRGIGLTITIGKYF